MIAVRTPDGDKMIAALSILTPDGAKAIARTSILGPGGDVVVWDGGAGGAFSVTITPDPSVGAQAYPSNVSVATQTVSVAIEGGMAPFSYAWAKTTGTAGWSVLAPSSASTAFRHGSVAPYTSEDATFTVTVTDARGQISTAIVAASARNYGDLRDGFAS